MSAFFFGPPDRQLFGYFHDGGYSADRAALICPSWGLEYTNAHRTLRVLARRLSESGYHVLQFDYSGTGDSWGDSVDASFERWQEDVTLAVRELQTRSGCSGVVLIGLRLGAYTVAKAAARAVAVEAAVLWDPVIDGATWTAELAAQGAPTYAAGHDVEFGSRLISQHFHEQIAHLDPSIWTALAGMPVLLITTAEATEAERTRELLAITPESEFVHIKDFQPWIEDAAISLGQVPSKVLRTIVDWCDSK
jgi:pimeloyl-ACP methyl ester carboxylesterase